MVTMTNGIGIELHSIKVSKLRDVAASAGLDANGKKAELIERLEEENVELTSEGWKHDGEQFEVEPRSDSKPSDTKLVYGFRQSDCTDEIMGEIKELLEQDRFEVREGETETGKQTFRIVIPKENDDSE